MPGGSVSHWVIAPFHGAPECLSKIIPFGERPLRRAMNDYLAHYHTERNHQGKNNVLLFPQMTETRHDKPVRCRDRLGGLLRYYHRAAA